MTIGFNQIPVGLTLPGVYVEFDDSLAVSGLTNWPNRLLIYAPKLDTGTATGIFQHTTDADTKAKLGAGSVGYALVKRARDNSFNTVETWVIPVDDPAGGVQKTADYTIDTVPTVDGTWYLYVGGKRYQVGLSTTDTPTTIATKASNALQDADAQFTATSSADVLTITARHKGAIGNEILVFDTLDEINETLPDGFGYSLTSSTDGTGVPDISSIVIPEKKYNTILIPFTDDVNLDAIETELDRRWGPLAPFDGHAHTALRGDLASLNVWAGNRNSKHLSVLELEQNTPEPVYLLAADLAGANAYYLGGIDQGRPMQRKNIFKGIPAKEQDRFTRADRELLAQYGFATQNVTEGGEWNVEYVATTMTLNSAGEETDAYATIETLYTLSYLRYSLIAFYTQRFPDWKLASNGSRIPQGQPIVTPNTLNATGSELFELWLNAGLVEGEYEGFFERNLTNRDRVDAVISPDLINQFRILGVQLQYIR